MGLDVYFRRDIANQLMATLAAVEDTTDLALDLLDEVPVDTTEQKRVLEAYRRGQRVSAIQTALAFGLAPVAVSGQSLGKDQQGRIRNVPQLADFVEVKRDR